MLDAAASAFGFAYDTQELPFGGAAIDAHGEPVPRRTCARP